MLILLSTIATRVNERLRGDFCTGHDLRFTLDILGREEYKDRLVEYGSVGISKGLTLAVRQKQFFS